MYEGARQDIEEFMYGNTEYYLSDGGFSRVVISRRGYDDDGMLFLTSNSTDKVKSRWDDQESVMLREAIENARQAFVDELFS